MTNIDQARRQRTQAESCEDEVEACLDFAAESAVEGGITLSAFIAEAVYQYRRFERQKILDQKSRDEV